MHVTWPDNEAFHQVLASQRMMESKANQAKATAVRFVLLIGSERTQPPWPCFCIATCTTDMVMNSMKFPLRASIFRTWYYTFVRQIHFKANPSTVHFYAAEQDLWYRRAETAIARGEESLAREALQRRKTYQVCAQGHFLPCFESIPKSPAASPCMPQMD